MLKVQQALSKTSMHAGRPASTLVDHQARWQSKKHPAEQTTCQAGKHAGRPSSTVTGQQASTLAGQEA